MRLHAAPLLLGLAACSGGGAPALTPAAVARADGGKPPYSAADVRFMAGMIPHHAQAVLIARWAPTHGAGSAIRALAARVVVGQNDEIALMRQWLIDRGEAVPDSAAHHHMPGMLTDAQLAQLDRARGTEFDKLWLTFMIQHHQGAITMVEELFGSHGAAQDETVFKLASDIHVDQVTEIDFMSRMLAELSSQGRTP
jgi:uncharacterized protein (DUF305 family)